LASEFTETPIRRRQGSEKMADEPMANRTQPKTVKEWIRYIAVAVVALWLVIWMLRISGINIF
jgi:hypothetical protein